MPKGSNDKYGSNRKKIIVNGITLSRILAAFALIPIYHFVGGAAAVGFLATMFCTDFIDGKLARGWKVSSFFGSIADAVSDKVLALLAAILLLPSFPLAMGWILGLETLILSKNLYEAKKGNNIQSTMIGKIKTWPLALTIIGGFAIADIGTIITSLQTLPNFCQNISWEPLRNFLFSITNGCLSGIMPVLEMIEEKPKEAMGLLASTTVVAQELTLYSYFHSGQIQDRKRKEEEQQKISEVLSIEEQELLGFPKAIQQAQYEEEMRIIEGKIKAIREERDRLKQFQMKSKEEIMEGLFSTPYFEEHKDEPLRMLLFKPNHESEEK